MPKSNKFKNKAKKSSSSSDSKSKSLSLLAGPVTAFLESKKSKKRTTHRLKENARKEARVSKKGLMSKRELMYSELEISLQTAAPSTLDIKPAAVMTKSLSGKMTQSLAVRETQRMRLVQMDDAFKSNPFDAVQIHLRHVSDINQKKPSKEMNKTNK
jgi:hypothetical protein